jgi:glucose-1-phosphate thymidylyltransferase
MELKGVVVVAGSGPAQALPASGWREAAEHVANKPIVLHVLDELGAVGVREIVVVSAADCASDVRACLAECEQRQRLHYVAQAGPIDLGNALRLAAPRVGDAPCILHLANGLFGETLELPLRRLRAGAPDLIVTVHQRRGPALHLSAATQQMLHLAELYPERAALSMAGVCVFGPDALRCLSATTWSAGDETDLTQVAGRISMAGGSLQVLPGNAWCQYSGEALELLELNRIALDRTVAECRGPSDAGNRVEGRVWVDQDASVCSSVIVGPAVIAPGAQVKDAYIGPYTSIGADARIEGAEIERSIIAPGASITHVGGRLVASVVGRDARVFRDFSLPRALRLRVGDGTEVALC